MARVRDQSGLWSARRFGYLQDYAFFKVEMDYWWFWDGMDSDGEGGDNINLKFC